MKYYLTGGNKVLVYAKTWINCENIMLSEENSHKGSCIVWFHLYETFNMGKSIETGIRLAVTQS